MSLRILIVDDEAPARARLRGLVEELGHQVCAEAADAAEASHLIKEWHPDLVLLDIQMPGDDGLVLARRLEAGSRPLPVILVTAYPEYALEAFDASVQDYLLKPVRKERLAKALNRLDEARQGESPAKNEILLTVGRKERLVPLDEIDCFVADGGYVVARSAVLEGFVDATLSELESRLGNKLVRVHRSCLVVRTAIAGIHSRAPTHFTLLLRDGSQSIPISRRRVRAIKNILGGLGNPVST